MKYCPLMSFTNNYVKEVYCMGEDCAMAADDAGECLVRQALQCYVSSERTRVAEETERLRRETERLRRETELANMYQVIQKNGTRTPIQFLQNDNEKLTPVQDPYSGLYKNSTPLSNNDSSITEVKLRPPAIDGSYIHF